MFAALGLVATHAYLDRAPQLYRTQSTLLVKTRTGTLLGGGHATPEEIDLRSVEALNTAASRIFTPEVLQRVASRQEVRRLPGLMPRPTALLPPWLGGPELATDAAPPVPPPARLAAILSNWMQVSARQDTRFLDVAIVHPDPQVARTLADAVAHSYLDGRTEVRLADRSAARRLVRRETEQIRDRLQAAQRLRAGYARMLELGTELDQQQVTVSLLGHRYREAHPKMKDALEEQARLAQRFVTEFKQSLKRGGDEAYWQDVGTIETADTAAEDAETIRRRLLSRAAALAAEVEALTGSLQALMSREGELDLELQGDGIEVALHSPAPLPGRPIAPCPSRAYALGGGGGLVCGLVLSLGMARSDEKIRTPAQLEAELAIPLLASVPALNAQRLQRMESRAARADGLGAPEHQSEWDPLLVFRQGLHRSPPADRYRLIETRIHLSTEGLRCVAIASSLPGEGKTTTSTNLALAAADRGKRVLLIDADLRKPAVHTAFGLDPDVTGAGLTEVLAGQSTLEEAVLPLAGVPRLDLLLSGQRAPNPGELLTGPGIETLLSEAGQDYDLVVLDTAPLLPVPDTRLIAPWVDRLYLVVRADHTPKGAVQHAINLLIRAQTPAAACILNAAGREKLR
ncbi:tyrosine-protein kinase domain-containing protein [Haloferula sargassicola]|uniref:tyrosine-protein kinase domain-containing protein n=1 Tax=Haloferula sargassicola TaxID=490096 RepID=UPI003365948F